MKLIKLINEELNQNRHIKINTPEPNDKEEFNVLNIADTKTINMKRVYNLSFLIVLKI